MDHRIDGEPTRQQVLEANLHRAPSVGGVLKQLLDINPGLDTGQLTAIIRQSTRRQGAGAGDFAVAEVIDVPTALALARATLSS